MKGVVNWIPLKIKVRSRNAQPHLKHMLGIEDISDTPPVNHLVMREFMSGLPRYRIAISRAVRVFRTEFRTLEQGFLDLSSEDEKCCFGGSVFIWDVIVLTSIRAATRLVSVHRLLRFNITFTCFVSVVLHADGIPPAAFLAASDIVNKPHLHAPAPIFQLWPNLAEIRFQKNGLKLLACVID